MNKKETAEIVKLMNAYFRQTGTATVATMIDAWHEALKDEEYKTIKRAVVEFAKTDRREYPTWPGVGQIMAAAETVKDTDRKPVAIVFNSAVDGKPYRELPEEIQARITPERYGKYLKTDPERLIAYGKQYREEIKKAMEAEQ